MSRTPKQTPIEQRCGQIEKELEKLRLPKNQKTRRDFKSDENFENWKEKQGIKFFQLNEELIILDNPAEYSEIPLALAATELGISLNDILALIDCELIELSSTGEYKAGARVTRDEVGQIIERDVQDLLRIARQDLEEIFLDGVDYLHKGEIEAAQKAYDRLDKHYSCIDPQALALELGIQLCRENYDGVSDSLDFVVNRNDEGKIVETLKLLKTVADKIEPKDFLGKVMKEQILAVAEGKKKTPFDRTYSSYSNSEYFSQMDENQRHSMFLATVVMKAIEKYKYTKWLNSSRWSSSDPKAEEIERIIRNAIYTALEAESTYYDSPSSKLFVDKYVELLPKRWIPAERIILLPKNEKVKIKS